MSVLHVAQLTLAALLVFSLAFSERDGWGGIRVAIVDSLRRDELDAYKMAQLVQAVEGAPVSLTLYVEERNRAYVAKLRELLGDRGLRVVHMDVEFFRRFFSDVRYDIVILYAHSSYVSDPERWGWRLRPGSVAIMTNEYYSRDRYVIEQLTEQLLPMVLRKGDGGIYFAFTEHFVRENFGLHGTLVVLLGCHSLYTDGMARAFLEKGALAYLGFNGYVDTDHCDMVAHALLSKALAGDRPLAEVLSEMARDPYFGSNLRFHTSVNLKGLGLRSLLLDKRSWGLLYLIRLLSSS